MQLFERGIRAAAGKLTLSFANVAAYRRFDPANPTVSRFVDEDFNRLWDAATLDGKRQSAELARARAFRPLIDTVDLLLDLHSMQQAIGAADARRSHRQVAGARPPRRRARHSSCAMPATPPGARMRDYAAFADPASPKAALLVECGQHWETRRGRCRDRDDAGASSPPSGVLDPA